MPPWHWLGEVQVLPGVQQACPTAPHDEPAEHVPLVHVVHEVEPEEQVSFIPFPLPSVQ